MLLGAIDEQGNWHVEQARPLRNTHSSPVYFEFDPAELLAVELDHPGGIIGVYHSHPTGFARASSTDKENMRRVNLEEEIPWVWLIISGPFDTTFIQNNQGYLPNDAMVAYHHYEREGLREIWIEG